MQEKRIFIIHGWGGSPEEPMHKWIRNELKNKGFRVEEPIMPNSDEPEINAWINKIKSTVKNPNENTTLIGHSIGCQAILRYLAILDSDVNVGNVVLIAPWIYLDDKTIEEEGEESIRIAKPWVETPISWKKIKIHSNNFSCIFSDNDSFVPLPNKYIFEKELGAKIIVEHNKGHFDPDSGVKKLEVILKLI